MQLKNKIEALKERAYMLKKARSFFDQKNILEVDCPILTQGASVDLHIELFSLTDQNGQKRFLHSSPEYGMKRLLAEGIGDIFQLSHVFRREEEGAKHQPEFTLAEWYRLGYTLESMMEETVEFIRLFLGPLPYQIISYREAFLRYSGIDYVKASEQELFNYIQKNNLACYPSIKEEGKDALLNLILGSVIEPLLGKESLDVICDYPASQAALAKKKWQLDEEVAQRFEVYFQGVELANGYYELLDSQEQRNRFDQTNILRRHFHKEALTIDEKFLAALEKGIPDCCGVAVGFDRLLMLRLKTTLLSEVVSWSWSEA